MLAIWDGLSWEDGVALAVIVLVAYLVVMWLAALVWVYRDIASRTRDPMTQTIGILLLLAFNLPGLLLYLILRPKETLAERYDRQLEAEALLQELHDQPTCTSCHRKVENEFVTCPYCRAALRTPCSTCGKALAFGWVVCPYCGATRSDAAPAAPTPLRPAESAEKTADEQVQASLASRAQAAPRPRRRPSTATFTPPAPKPQPAQQPDTAPDIGG